MIAWTVGRTAFRQAAHVAHENTAVFALADNSQVSADNSLQKMYQVGHLEKRQRAGKVRGCHIIQECHNAVIRRGTCEPDATARFGVGKRHLPFSYAVLPEGLRSSL